MSLILYTPTVPLPAKPLRKNRLLSGKGLGQLNHSMKAMGGECDDTSVAYELDA